MKFRPRTLIASALGLAFLYMCLTVLVIPHQKTALVVALAGPATTTNGVREMLFTIKNPYGKTWLYREPDLVQVKVGGTWTTLANLTGQWTTADTNAPMRATPRIFTIESGSQSDIHIPCPASANRWKFEVLSYPGLNWCEVPSYKLRLFLIHHKLIESSSYAAPMVYRVDAGQPSGLP